MIDHTLADELPTAPARLPFLLDAILAALEAAPEGDVTAEQIRISATDEVRLSHGNLAAVAKLIMKMIKSEYDKPARIVKAYAQDALDNPTTAAALRAIVHQHLPITGQQPPWQPPYFVAIDPTEQQLVGAVRSGDPAARQVYADWLEQHGFASRAAYIRDETTAAPEDRSWRVVISRAKLLACNETQCESRWDRLPGDHEEQRTCATCNKVVRYCETIADVEKHLGHVMAIDPSLPYDQALARYERWKNAPPPTMNPPPPRR